MVNVTGSNGQDPGNVPPDDILRDTLHGYARENLTLEIRLERLISDLGYHIKRTKLSQLNKKFGVPSVRKPPNRPMATTLILAKMAEDPQQRNGPNAVKTFLSLDGVAIPRSTVREVMHDNAPEGAALRQPGGRNKIQRKNLVSYGVFQEVNMDGHEKLGRAALRMGPVGIDIYGCRDKCTGLIARLVVVPNARKATTIGHFYLDFIEEYGAIPLQVTVDKGSETGEMYALHTSLREQLTPQLDLDQWPAFVALKSVNNVVIEGCWHWLRKSVGHSIEDILAEGRHNGLFNAGNDIHVNLFNWLWPQIVQVHLDDYRNYWNSHRVRKQDKKLMPSGGTPLDMYSRPSAYGIERLSRPVLSTVIHTLRQTIEVSRDEAFRWVDDEFAQLAEDVFAQIGSPTLRAQNGWDIFGRMTAYIDEM